MNASIPEILKSVNNTPPRKRCIQCRELIDPAYKYCPHCGQRQQRGSTWYYHPFWVLILALFALGPFALILVWRSSRMGRWVKIILAVIIVAYTVYCCYLFNLILQAELQQLDELEKVLR